MSTNFATINTLSNYKNQVAFSTFNAFTVSAPVAVTTSSAVIQQAAVQKAVQKGATGAAIVDPMKARSDQIFTENYHLKREVALHRERLVRLAQDIKDKDTFMGEQRSQIQTLTSNLGTIEAMWLKDNLEKKQMREETERLRSQVELFEKQLKEAQCGSCKGCDRLYPEIDGKTFRNCGHRICNGCARKVIMKPRKERKCPVCYAWIHKDDVLVIHQELQ
ncbi:unnamed protein product [Oikopleura dioica]|uniref:RING-type domain-containing protein n=1 Tax=Oikopleura dioica TaxID=34765 RepID=E4WXI5_OIKDI|nr:unnamed protein product [Oikopleura dioica]CBY33473.1 unnamed protein product [Oikopleura dioica]